MKVVEILIDVDANINVICRLHDTSLKTAAEGGDCGMARLLLSKGADINAIAHFTHFTDSTTALQASMMYKKFAYVSLSLG
jgi:ankyrin repeat protein